MAIVQDQQLHGSQFLVPHGQQECTTGGQEGGHSPTACTNSQPLLFRFLERIVRCDARAGAGDLLSLRLTSAETAETFALFLRLLVSMRRQHARVKDVKPKECRTLKKGQESRWVEHVGGK